MIKTTTARQESRVDAEAARGALNDLQAALEDCREQLAAADGADHEAIRRAAADIEAALERTDGQAIETAVQEIRAALGDSDDE